MSHEVIIRELADIRRALPKLTEEIAAAEERLAKASRHLEEAKARAFLESQGAVKVREMQTTISTSLVAASRDDAAAVVRYLKMRRADLETLQSSLQTTAKLLEAGHPAGTH